MTFLAIITAFIAGIWATVASLNFLSHRRDPVSSHGKSTAERLAAARSRLGQIAGINNSLKAAKQLARKGLEDSK